MLPVIIRLLWKIYRYKLVFSVQLGLSTFFYIFAVKYYEHNSQNLMPNKLHFMSFQITYNFVVNLFFKIAKPGVEKHKNMICYNLNNKKIWYSRSYYIYCLILAAIGMITNKCLQNLDNDFSSNKLLGHI